MYSNDVMSQDYTTFHFSGTKDEKLDFYAVCNIIILHIMLTVTA
jgi:hypothetical protein